ncbi:MAG: COX15/CtaA family protein, partial [Pseudomonadota bacterium]|nr:COX15/CtaA family protein [Pseudomonadota bacterium]
MAKENRISRFWMTAVLATVLAMTVVTLGAWTRLKDAGLGCPDWPTCYGQLTVPESTAAISKAAKAFPGQTIEPHKAWPEMIHRYFAMSLGLLILTLAIWSLIRRLRDKAQPVLVSVLLVGLVIFQALLGKWTVTWLLHPLIVMGHLLGGMTIAAGLWWVALNAKNYRLNEVGHRWLKPLATIGTLIVFTQIFLGGWTSANYASI